jgi:hypothetical protein
MLALFDPECEVIFSPEVPEPGPFHGHTELRGWAEGFLETDAHVFTFSNGKVTRWRNFSDRSEALEAAGLRE